VTILRTTPTST